MKASFDALRSNQKTESELVKTAAYITRYACVVAGGEERAVPDERH